jgi:hypothetical protein
VRAGINELVDDGADRRAGRKAGGGVGLAALDADHQLAELDRHALKLRRVLHDPLRRM